MEPLTSPALQQARDALLARRRERGPGAIPSNPATARHDPLQLAYRTVGGEPVRHITILYCPACLRGHAQDMVRELPEGIPNAQELGLRQMRPWRLECAEAYRGA